MICLKLALNSISELGLFVIYCVYLAAFDGSLRQRMLTSGPRHTVLPQEFLKHAISDYLAKGTYFFSLRLSNFKKWQQPIQL